MNWRVLIAAQALALFFALPVFATPVTFDFTVDDGGKPVTGSVTWLPSDTPIVEVTEPDAYFYPDAVIAASFGGVSLDVSSSVDNGVYVFLDDSGITGFRLNVDNEGMDGKKIIKRSYIDLRLYSSDPETLTSYDLPAELPPLSDFTESNLLIFVYDGAVSGGPLTMISEVPEPSSLSMLAAALLLTGIGARRWGVKIS
jgi:hypothetical protein